MKISIVTVCFNCAKTIEKTIRSVIDQGYSDLEYIIIDGGSNDGTLDVIKNYSDYISCLVSEKDNGIYDAMNKGIDLATGELIAFVNDGDWYENNVFENISGFYEENPVDVIFGDIYDHNEDKMIPMVYSDKSPSDIYSGKTICHQGCFIRTSLMKQYKYDTSYKIASDQHFLANVYSDGCIFRHFRGFIVNYTEGGFSASDNELMFKEQYRIVLEINRRKPEISLDGFWGYFHDYFLCRMMGKEDKWSTDHIFLSTVSEMVKSLNKPVAVFGNGKMGKRVQRALALGGKDDFLIIDNNNDLDSFLPENVPNIDKYCIINTPVKFQNDIRNQLLSLGCKDDNIMNYRDFFFNIGKKYYEHCIFS